MKVCRSEVDGSCAGQTLVPSSGDGRVTVLELWLATDSAAEAADVEKALTRLQLRSYPDILALSQAFMTYSQMYEQCKADQIEACSQYTKMYLAVQVWALCNIARSANLAACHRVVMPPEPTPPAYSQIYGQCKVDQIEARFQYSRMPLESNCVLALQHVHL